MTDMAATSNSATRGMTNVVPLDMAAWPVETKSVITELKLDPTNVRLEIASAQVEADIVEDLFTNEGALGLVEMISKVGYLTHERPIVVASGDGFIVVEGNRRVAALKAIQNPNLVPTHQARVADMASSIPNRSRLERIEVIVAPDRESADQVIAAIHTGNLRRPWTPVRQAAFFAAQIQAGRTYQELLARYPTINVRSFVLQSNFVKMLEDVQYDDPALNDYTTTREWKRAISTLSRLYESRAFTELIGLQMDASGSVNVSISPEAFKAVATVILRGIRSKDLTTRSLNATGL